LGGFCENSYANVSMVMLGNSDLIASASVFMHRIFLKRHYPIVNPSVSWENLSVCFLSGNQAVLRTPATALMARSCGPDGAPPSAATAASSPGDMHCFVPSICVMEKYFCCTPGPHMHQSASRQIHFLRHLNVKPIILPRQARDKYRENPKKSQLRAAPSSCRVHACGQSLTDRLGVRPPGLQARESFLHEGASGSD
jgi:hypothetical protein